MSLSDRDYARRPPLAGRSRARKFSFNTWIIIVNILVFVVNNVFFAANPRFHSAIPVGIDVVDGVTSDRFRNAVVEPRQDPVAGRPDLFASNIYDARTGELLGRRKFTVRPWLEAYGHFATARVMLWRDPGGNSGLEVWRFVTFQFLHANVTHLLFNMLGLWFVGSLVEHRLGFRRYGAFYLVCGIFGALMYLLLNLLGWGFGVAIPGVLFSDPFTPLVGASAGVFGVMLAAAYLAPHERVDVLFAIPMKMRTAVYLFVALAAVNLLRGGSNAGGDAAHMGGAIAGAYFIRHTHLLRDFFEIFSRRAHPPRSRRAAGPPRISDRQRAEVDRILAKVTAQGLDSLTEREAQTLHAASEAFRTG